MVGLASSLIFLIVSLLCLFMIRYRKKHHRFNKLMDKLPGPSGLPLIGHALMFAGNTHDILYRFKELGTSSTPVKLWVGPFPLVLISKPEHLQILSNHPQALQRDQIQKSIGKPWIGKSFFLAEVQQWRQKRKTVVQTFSQKILDSFVPIFAEQSKLLADSLTQEAESQRMFDAWNYIAKATLDSIIGTAMGIQSSTESQNSQYQKAAVSQIKIVCERFFSLWLVPDAIFKWTSLFKKQCENLETIHSFEERIIAEKKWQYQQEHLFQKQSSSQNFDDSRRQKVFLDYLIELTENDPKWTDKDLHGEVSFFLVAGFETSAKAICFTLMALAFYQDIQSKVYEEIYDIFGSSDRDPDPADLNRMNYLEMVIKEAIRQYPIIPIISRETADDIKLDEYIIPKGVILNFSLMSIHYNPEIWPNPSKFDPERFQPEEVAKRHPYAFFGFGGGLRKCIGYKYAIMSIKTALSTILRKYEIRTDLKPEDLKLKIELTLAIDQGFLIQLKKRESVQ